MGLLSSKLLQGRALEDDQCSYIKLILSRSVNISQVSPLKGLHQQIFGGVEEEGCRFSRFRGSPLDDGVTGGLKALIEEEKKLDELIQSSAWQISTLCEEDLHQRYPCLEEQTVIVIKAPSETQLQVPHPEESFQIYLSSINGPIDVFLCSDTPVPMDSTDTPAAGSATCGQFQLTTCGKEFFAPLPPFFSVQTSSK
ncbi:hypothetical protein ATANTOWER_019085, partial [Ataeniobius toweri]|nr:hypothetical protein [Ataeniobius toweri]